MGKETLEQRLKKIDNILLFLLNENKEQKEEIKFLREACIKSVPHIEELYLIERL